MFLLDTNVVSELRQAGRNRADAGVVAWASSVPAFDLFISSITVHEIELGVLLAERTDPAKGAELRTWFDRQLVPAFAARTVPVDTAVARAAAAFHVPDPAPIRDAFIGATAQCHDLTVVTRNVRDFARFGVPILNPWTMDPGQSRV